MSDIYDCYDYQGRWIRAPTTKKERHLSSKVLGFIHSNDGEGLHSFLTSLKSGDRKTAVNYRLEGYSGNLGTSENLANGGMSIDCPDKPLLHAISHDSAGCVQALLDNGADAHDTTFTDGEDMNDISYLLCGILDNKRTAVGVLLSRLPTILSSEKDQYHFCDEFFYPETFLDFALKEGHKNIARDLMRKGAWSGVDFCERHRHLLPDGHEKKVMEQTEKPAKKAKLDTKADKEEKRTSTND
mmetsp:Transcript_23439/g.26890  ORF Transcript_23439/g.26890 Transcript_23439/m.26890 type:complete len:242 (-) Transcript_23439:156-881(-)